MKAEIQLVEMPTAVCHHCHRQFSAGGFGRLPLEPDPDGPGWRQCPCGERLPAELGDVPPLIASATQLRRAYPDEPLPGFPFWAEVTDSGTWRRLDDGRAALGLPSWLTSRRTRMIVLAGLALGWAIAALIARWW